MKVVGTTQEIRLAVVLNGGVSLAVWMSGVTQELNRLVQASRRRTTGTGESDAYYDLLKVLDAEARIDVIAGTSAGGINGGFLALGVVHGTDLADLRTLWQTAGSLGTLLRNPRDKNQPSLLRGEYFHTELARAYRNIWKSKRGVPAPDGEDVDLFLTGTLWQGRRSFFADDMGRRITERDYDATFHFTSDPEVLGPSPASQRRGNLHGQSVTDQLAVASRCTASFPAAFEPFRVDVDAAPKDGGAQQLADGRWASTAGRTNFELPQFVIDGGILRNKPIRPAIDAVYRQSAGEQVRRILAYVVPDPGEPAKGPGKPKVDELPGASDVLLGVMTRLRSTDSVADELAEIRRRNQETSHRRSARDRMAETLLQLRSKGGAKSLLQSAYAGYLEVRRKDSAQSVARLLASSPVGEGWSQRELATQLDVVLTELAKRHQEVPFLPQPDLESALGARPGDWRWGQATVRRLGDLVIDVLKRAVWLAPLDDPRRTTIVAQRARSHEILHAARTDRIVLDAFWRNAEATNAESPGLAEAPLDDEPEVVATREQLTSLREDLEDLVAGWNRAGGASMVAALQPFGPYELMKPRLYRRAFELARCLQDAGDALRAIADGDRSPIDRDGSEQARLRPLVKLLLPPGATTQSVLRNMLWLEVLHVAFVGVADVAEQGVELVQVSSLRKELVTGIQLHHFGAFYRESWRANDWMRGRLDGSQQLVEMLLAPERLRQLGLTPESAREHLRSVAVPADGPGHQELAAAWDDPDMVERLTEELEVLRGDGPLPRTFPLTAERIADRLRVEMLPQELASLATAVVTEPDPVQEAVTWADRAAARLQQHQQGQTQAARKDLLDMLGESEVVGEQTVVDEAARGSDTFAQTVTHAAATLTASGASIKKPKAAVTLLKGLRGYAVLLWVLVNFAAGGSRFGRNLTYVVLGVGGALVALALIVPGVPAIVPITGIVLILACASAAALRNGKRSGWWLAFRFLLLLALALGALAVVIWQRMEAADQGWKETAMDLIPPVAVVLAVVLLGWFIGRPGRRTV